MSRSRKVSLRAQGGEVERKSTGADLDCSLKPTFPIRLPTPPSAPLDLNPTDADVAGSGSAPGPSTKRSKDIYVPHRFNIIEALSATGLRSIRYAQEIEGCKYVAAGSGQPDHFSRT
jgi:tRNA G26 N,N-dimethylase Trm1